MSQPSPFSLKCLEWHVFHVPIPTQYRRKRDGRVVRVSDEKHDILEWCDDTLQGSWTWGANQGGSVRPFYIQDASDAMLFKLTWFDRTQKPVFR